MPAYMRTSRWTLIGACLHTPWLPCTLNVRARPAWARAGAARRAHLLDVVCVADDVVHVEDALVLQREVEAAARRAHRHQVPACTCMYARRHHQINARIRTASRHVQPCHATPRRVITEPPGRLRPTRRGPPACTSRMAHASMRPLHCLLEQPTTFMSGSEDGAWCVMLGSSPRDEWPAGGGGTTARNMRYATRRRPPSFSKAVAARCMHHAVCTPSHEVVLRMWSQPCAARGLAAERVLPAEDALRKLRRQRRLVTPHRGGHVHASHDLEGCAGACRRS